MLSDTKTNIFKELSHNCDKDCYLINCQCNQDCYCDKYNQNIRRLCFNPDIYYHESYIYLSLLRKDSNITSMISVINNEIIYHVKSYCSLRNYILKNISNLSIVFNELFKFISIFKNYNFVHGNLHIDNIYVNEKKSTDTRVFFCIIDLCNSYFLDDNILFDCRYKRTSFLGEYDSKKGILYYWDFCSIFISLSIFLTELKILKKNPYWIEYIKKIIKSYIGDSQFEKFILDYNVLLSNENYDKIKIKYHSI